MLNIVEAVSALCRLSLDELDKIESIDNFRFLLTKKWKQSLSFTKKVALQLERLQGICEAEEASALVGKTLQHDSRIVDIRLVKGRTISNDLS